jgi:hypothetical protein
MTVSIRLRAYVWAVGVCSCIALFMVGSAAAGDSEPKRTVSTPLVVFAANDLGMHCMNSDFSELLVLPPFNTLHAQVVERGIEPDIISAGITVQYVIPQNTQSAGKSNFWTYWPAGFGPRAPADVGLTGNRLAGTMVPTGANDWAVTGIPITPIDDLGRENPYQLALVTVIREGSIVARTQAVVPVSTEMNCQLCHKTPDISTALDVLRAHDRLHGTTLEQARPVLCAGCHADNALGAPGLPGISNLSSAMHTAHATRMSAVQLVEPCYGCHPGIRTKCQRDVHFSHGLGCTYCHGSMAAVGSPIRNPWVDEPRCGGCHTRPGYQFEQTATLFRNSRGHAQIHCWACHGSPHAIAPAVTAVDNLQASTLQGYPGVISNCLVCHSGGAPGAFFHRVDDK